MRMNKFLCVSTIDPSAGKRFKLPTFIPHIDRRHGNVTLRSVGAALLLMSVVVFTPESATRSPADASSLDSKTASTNGSSAGYLVDVDSSSTRNHVAGVTFVVNSAGDDFDALNGDGICETVGGMCTLRAALAESDMTPGPDIVNFAIPGAGPHTISLTNGVIWVWDSVLIDGYSQSGSQPNTIPFGPLNTELRIILDGTGLPVARGIEFLGDDCRIQGFVVQNFSMAGIISKGERNVIAGNFIGTDVTGRQARPNGTGVHIWSADPTLIAGHNTVGGTSPGDRNLISGNNKYGIKIEEASDNIVSGNLIGVDITGTAALGNGSHGVLISGADDVAPTDRNLVGGPSPESENIISGNKMSGLAIGWGVSNRISGNIIGLRADQSQAIGNGRHGISLLAETLVDGNVISGNVLSGIYLITAAASQSRIFANLIGTNTSDATDLGNSLHGIVVNPGVQWVWIGDGTIANGNAIVFNGGDGVRIGYNDSAESGNRVLGNQIYGNGGLGIDLNGDGVSRNDPVFDPDTGPNGLQNFPEIESVVASKQGTTITGILSSEPSRAFRIEFFSNDAWDSSGFGEGQNYLGFQDVTTNALGVVFFSFSVLAPAENVSATATNLGTGDTSEFSGNTRFVVNSTDDDPDILVNDGICDTGDKVSNGGSLEAECTLRAAIEETNSTPDDAIINFDIPTAVDPGCMAGSGCVIRPKLALPQVFWQILIDGYTQPGSVVNTGVFGEGLTTVLRIALDGFNAGSGVSGLSLSSSGSTIRGLNIRNFSAAGIELVIPQSGAQPSNNVISGNFIGTNRGGTAKSPNSGDGIVLRGMNNRVGGDDPAERNLISGNGSTESSAGVRLHAGATGNTVSENLIGTDISGTAAVHNKAAGVVIQGDGTDGNTVSMNLISGNGDPSAVFGTTCRRNGVLISDFAASNVISDNYIGTSANGVARIANRQSGICVRNAGMSNEIKQNVISGNEESGIEVTSDPSGDPGDESEDLIIRDNTIGLDHTGGMNLGNVKSGITNFGAPGLQVDDNLISGNDEYGIELRDAADDNSISGNQIGTDLDGTGSVPNLDSGIYVHNATNLVVDGNVISGNAMHGILLAPKARNTTISNNFIGTDASGGANPPLTSVPNGGAGIRIDGAVGTIVGGPDAVDENVISGNKTYGIHISGIAPGGNTAVTVSRNVIGADETATVAIPNDSSGIFIDGVSRVRVERNTIAYNKNDGVRIVGAADKDIITRNSIFKNQGLGIDLGGDGQTMNDNQDADAGVNKLMNNPFIGMTEIDGIGDLRSRITVDASAANASYPLTIEFFSADQDAEEGWQYLASASYTLADARIEKIVNLGKAAGLGIFGNDIIISTATDSENNTSEFSFPQIVNPPAGGVAFDFGDAPESGPPQGPTPYGYPTTLANDGARHVFSSFIRLGDNIDDETDGLPTIDVAGDDTNQLDDDDGIVFETATVPNPGFDPIPLLLFGPNEVTVLNSVSGIVSAWIDFNRDGDWSDAGEQVLTDITVASGPNHPKQAYNIPQTAQPGYSVARFRFSTQTGLAPTGLASNGEVEDYLVRLTGVTNTEDGEGAVPQTFALYQNYPNPFNSVTTIRYSLPTAEFVRLVVYDLIGREIRVLTDEMKTAGHHDVRFDAARLPSGLYFYDISGGAYQARRKLLLIK